MAEEIPDEARETHPGLLSRTLGAVPLGQAQQLTEETATRLLRAFETSQPVRRLRGSQFATAVLGTVGFALFIFGVERAAEDIPILSNPYVSMAAGLLLAATGLMLRRLMGGE